MKEGYWLKNNKSHQVHDHAQWAHDHKMTPKDLNPLNEKDRVEILLHMMNDGWIRIRGHGTDVTFEFTGNTDSMLWNVYHFLKKTGLAGPLAHLVINNVRTKEMIQMRCDEFMKEIKSEGPTAIMREELKHNHKMIKKILERIGGKS